MLKASSFTATCFDYVIHFSSPVCASLMTRRVLLLHVFLQFLSLIPGQLLTLRAESWSWPPKQYSPSAPPYTCISLFPVNSNHLHALSFFYLLCVALFWTPATVDILHHFCWLGNGLTHINHKLIWANVRLPGNLLNHQSISSQEDVLHFC